MATKNNTKRHLTDRQKRAAENIRHYWHTKRINERITQTEFSKQLGWSHSIFGMYLNGRVPAGAAAIFKLAEGLNCTPFDIDPQLAGEFAPPPEDLIDLKASLKKMPSTEKIRLINFLAKDLHQRDLLDLLADFVEMARGRYSRSRKVEVTDNDSVFQQQRIAANALRAMR